VGHEKATDARRAVGVVAAAAAAAVAAAAVAAAAAAAAAAAVAAAATAAAANVVTDAAATVAAAAATETVAGAVRWPWPKQQQARLPPWSGQPNAHLDSEPKPAGMLASWQETSIEV
jgi:hypothetical protein